VFLYETDTVTKLYLNKLMSDNIQKRPNN